MSGNEVRPQLLNRGRDGVASSVADIMARHLGELNARQVVSRILAHASMVVKREAQRRTVERMREYPLILDEERLAGVLTEVYREELAGVAEEAQEWALGRILPSGLEGDSWL